MKTLIFSLLFLSINLFAQNSISDNVVGTHTTYDNQKGLITITNPVLYNSNYAVKNPDIKPYHPDSSGSTIRYSYAEPVSIGEYCAEAGNGLSSIVGWYLNNMRVSDYGNSNSTPLWQFQESPTSLNYNFVAVSYDGSNVADGFFHSIILLNGSTGSPVWTYALTNYIDTVWAGPVGITRSGNFIIGTVNTNYASDSSWILGFNSSSNVPVWTVGVPPMSNGSAFQGIKISGNDSVAIVNEYGRFYVIRTYTGQILYTGTIGGTQTAQGISGNGNLIATIDYSGWLKVYQWNGSTYNLLWQNQEPPGSYYNWMTAVDISYDGTMVAGGTLNFLTSSSYDGKVKFWNTSSSTPVWTYAGLGDEVGNVSFSKNGRFLSAASWGNYYSPSTLNIVVFKTTHPVNIPWFAANSTGSFFWCCTSDDGQTVIGSGKAVHARQMGSGGIFYNLYIDTAENPVGINNRHYSLPESYLLSQNYPNPFNPSTIINYQLPKAGLVKLSVFNVLGQEVKVLINEYQQAGTYDVKFDASNIPSGVYFYKIQTNGFTDTKRMTVIK